MTHPELTKPDEALAEGASEASGFSHLTDAERKAGASENPSERTGWPVPTVEPEYGPSVPPAVRDILNGYAVTPVSGKAPVRTAWQKDPIRSGLDWLALEHDGNHGVVTTSKDRILVVDVDVGGKPGPDSLRKIVADSGLDLGPYPHQRTPSGGHHFVGRIPEGYPAHHLPNKTDALPGLDVQRDGKQFVRAPGRTDVGEYREVRPLPPLEALPTWPVSFLDALADAGSSSSTTDERPPEDLQAPSVDWVREAVRKVRNGGERFASRYAWQKMASAIKAAVGPAHEEEGLRIFSEFSSRWEDGTNDPNETERLYRTSPTGRVGWTWLAELAGDTVAVAQEEFEADPKADVPDATPSESGGNLVARFAEPLEEIEYTGPPGFLLDRLLLESDINFYAGDGGSFKTTGAIATACAVASGADVFDHRNPNGPQRVLYLSEEDDADQIKNKADAIVAGSGMEVPSGFLEIMALRGFTFGSEKWEKDLRSYVRDGDYGLVVFDPLAEMQRGKENSNDDARPIVRFLRSITARGGPAVVVIHHAGKGYEGQNKIDRYMRGASGFKNGARAIMGFSKAPDGFLIRPLKLSRTALPDTTSVKVRIQTDPEDEHGIRWTSATFEGAPRWKVERDDAELAIRSVLEEAGTLNSTNLRDEVSARGHKRPVVSKAINALQDGEVIDFDPGENNAKMWRLVESELPDGLDVGAGQEDTDEEID